MDRQEQYILLGVVAVLILGGVISVKFSGSTPADASLAARQSLKRGLADTTIVPRLYYNDWTCPPWSMEQAGLKEHLRSNHFLYRRPKYIGENRHKVMTEGWGGWYYNPPGEDA